MPDGLVEGCPLCARLQAAGAGFVADLPTGRLIVDPVQRYPFKATLIANTHIESQGLFDLDETDLLAGHADVVRAARAVKAASKALRVNLAMFANLAPHVHWHLVPRASEGDVHPPDLTPATPATDPLLAHRADVLRAHLT